MKPRCAWCMVPLPGEMRVGDCCEMCHALVRVWGVGVVMPAAEILTPEQMDRLRANLRRGGAL